MAAVIQSKNERCDSLLPQYSMTPVPLEFRKFLHQMYGIEPHLLAYFNEQEPTRIYVIVNGKLNYIDISPTNPSKTIQKRELALSGDSKARVYSNSRIWQMLTDVEREQLRKERHKISTYKTSLCRVFRKTGQCGYGEACIFAHGEEELRLPPTDHPKYKTQLCNKFIKWNYCPYGDRCQFIHKRYNENMRFTGVMKMGDSKSVRNNISHIESFSVEHMNTSIRSMSSPVALGRNLLLAEQSGFCHSVAGPVFNQTGNTEHFIETTNNKNTGNIVYRDQPLEATGPVMSNSILNQVNSVDNDNFLEWLDEQLKKMLVSASEGIFET
ncbi:Zinc finger C-x8-C-x5-C-x3-H type (and similar) family protein [Acanthocheilonema viteae]